MFKLRELKLKNRKTCDCGYLFSIQNMTKMVKNTDYAFYGGQVDSYSEAVCPKCGKTVVLLLKPCNNSYDVFDIGELNQEEKAKKTQIDTLTKREPTDKSEIEIANKIENPEATNKSGSSGSINSLICKKCKREFKSKQGVLAHERKCLKTEVE